MIYIDDILQVCDDSFVASCVGCSVSTVPALWCEEAIPRTSKLEKRWREGGREGERERKRKRKIKILHIVQGGHIVGCLRTDPEGASISQYALILLHFPFFPQPPPHPLFLLSLLLSPSLLLFSSPSHRLILLLALLIRVMSFCQMPVKISISGPAASPR